MKGVNELSVPQKESDNRTGKEANLISDIPLALGYNLFSTKHHLKVVRPKLGNTNFGWDTTMRFESIDCGDLYCSLISCVKRTLMPK